MGLDSGSGFSYFNPFSIFFFWPSSKSNFVFFYPGWSSKKQVFSLKIILKDCIFGGILDLGSRPELQKAIFSLKILLKNCIFEWIPAGALFFLYFFEKFVDFNFQTLGKNKKKNIFFFSKFLDSRRFRVSFLICGFLICGVGV